LKKNKKSGFKHLVSSVCHRHHFSNPNTLEIIFSLLFIGVVSHLLALLGRDAKY
jgi:hypothetical protein